jgi:hypothetical protein
MYSRDQMNTFLTGLLNSGNFFIFANIIQLKDYSLYKKVMEYLYDYKISIFDLHFSDDINDTTVASFLSNFDNKFNPPSILNNPDSTFNAQQYLFGLTSGFTFVYDQYKDFIRYLNENNSIIRDTFSLNITYSGTDPRSYTSEGAFIAEFNSLVLPHILSTLEVEDISELFPASSSYSVVSTGEDVVTNVRLKYDNLFSEFLPVLNNANLYKFMISRNTDQSSSRMFAGKFFELINFDKRHQVAKDLSLYYLLYLSSNSVPFTSDDRAGFLQKRNEADFSKDSRREFAIAYFYQGLVRLYDSLASSDTTAAYNTDLDNLVTKINVFKQLISLVYKFSNENLTKIAG